MRTDVGAHPDWAPVMAEIVEKRDQGTRGPETVMAEILILVDQGTRGPEGPAMAEINAPRV